MTDTKVKPHKLGNINACNTAILYKRKKVVGFCNDTPNAVAYGMKKTGATRGESRDCKFSSTSTNMKLRVKNAGWMKNDKDANFFKA